MEFFQLHHPPDVTVLCDRRGCEQVADYLEVDDHGHEYRSALRTPTARRMLRGCRRGNQVLIFLSEADLPLEPWRCPCRMRLAEEIANASPAFASTRSFAAFGQHQPKGNRQARTT
ncbi:MAG TPA: hypothetical protein VM912_08450, partial [Terriglobales bacterium]|nr:hypothetical protein [Terriglobales bacterium]